VPSESNPREKEERKNAKVGLMIVVYRQGEKSPGVHYDKIYTTFTETIEGRRGKSQEQKEEEI